MRVLKVLGIIAAVLIAVVIAFLIFMRFSMYSGSRGGKRIKMAPIVKFRFSASGGSYMNSGESYEAELADGKVTVRIRLDGVDEEDAEEFVTDESFLRKLDEIVERNNVKKWNGFSLSNRNVLDGHGFSLSIKMENGEYLTASSYMAWPDHYSEFKGEVAALFMELYDSSHTGGNS